MPEVAGWCGCKLISFDFRQRRDAALAISYCRSARQRQSSGHLLNSDEVVDERAMETTVVTADGEIVLPQVVCDAFNWAPGTRLSLELAHGGLLLREAPVFAPTSVEALFGSMQYAGSALSIEDMQAAVERGALYRGRAGS